MLGEHTITYHSGPDFKSIPINFACFKAVGQIDANGSRWLLGDHLGLLYALVLSSSNGIVTAAEALDDALGHLSEAQLRAELTARGVQLPHGPQARGFYMELCRRHGVTRVGTAAGVAASLPRYAAAPPVDYSTFRYAAKGQSGGW